MGFPSSFNRKTNIRPEMNVTPLVDVVLVLLIIFMVLAPVMSKQFWVRLPPKDQLEQQLDAANQPDAPLVLGVSPAGEFSINQIPVPEPELANKLTRMFNARPDNTLYVDASDETLYRFVLRAIDHAKGAQAWPIVMLTKHLE